MVDRAGRLGEVALWYASRGWYVHALHERDKKPILPLGEDFRASTRDPGVIERCWRRWPRANIGCNPHRSGLVAIDTDAKARGEEWWQGLCDRYGEAPTPLVVETGGGGRHRYYRWPTDVPIPRKFVIRYGVEFVGVGQQLVLPPSVHPSGKRYAWSFDAIDGGELAEPAEAPPWLVALAQHGGEGGGVAGPPGRPLDTLGERRPLTLAEAFEPAPEGERHVRAMRLAAWLFTHGLDDDRVLEIVETWNVRNPKPLPDDELRSEVAWLAKRERQAVELAINGREAS